MLGKFISIQSVGKFKRYSAAGDVQWRQLTLIYAPNGRGKTTLCDILRSLQSGDPSPITGRKTLGVADEPRVEILMGSGTVLRFENRQWTNRYAEVEIYDSRFVHDNVYAGDVVSHDHRRNLHSVVIGEQGILLRQKAEDLDAQFRESGKRVTDEEAALRKLLPTGLDIDTFLSLEADEQIDDKIAQAEREVRGLAQSAELSKKPALEPLALPAMPDGFEELLGRTLEDVSKHAEEVVRAHLAGHMREPDEEWLAKGLELLQGDVCPFCSQGVKGSELVRSFRGYFDDGYRALQREIHEMRAAISSVGEDAVAFRLERRIETNARLNLEWREVVTTADTPVLDLDWVEAALKRVQATALAVIERKMRSPLEAVEGGAQLAEALATLAEAQNRVFAYNQGVEAINAAIAKKKVALEGGDLGRAMASLSRLTAIKRRYEPEPKDGCDQVRRARVERKRLELDKLKARNDLETYSKDVLARYRSRINELLEQFGATFLLGKTVESYAGGKPSYAYCLLINKEEVDLGDESTPLSRPSFKNTLSAGDRSALALAFFLAKAERRADLEKTIVVLDDPFTSQDSARQMCTQQEICKMKAKAMQVVVLSHDRRFLKRIWDEIPTDTRKALQLSQLGDTAITEWDIDDEVQDEYVMLFKKLWKYCHRNEGDPASVAQTIRLLLEGYLRMKLPGEFESKDWLGDYVKQIASADPLSPVGQAKGLLPELEALKDYSKRYHHAGGPAASVEPADPAEVLAFGKRALKLVQSF